MSRLTASVATVLALAVAVPAFAGSACGSGDKTSATTTEASRMTSSRSDAWTGAWLQRSTSGQVTVAQVAKGSPAARSGLKTGDMVLAVNGYDLNSREDRAMCASKAECTVGKTITYKVQRGSDTKSIRFKLEKMPTDATARFPNRKASFEPALAAVVMPSLN